MSRNNNKALHFKGYTNCLSLYIFWAYFLKNGLCCKDSWSKSEELEESSELLEVPRLDTNEAAKFILKSKKKSQSKQWLNLDRTKMWAF